MNKDIFLKQLKKLVSFKTTVDNPSQSKKALDYVVSLINTSAVLKRIKNKNTEILIALNKNTNTPDIAFIAHMDVVPGSPEQFKLRVKQDRIMGRGASDMKFAIPIGVSLLNKVIDNNLKASFALVISTDEEVGGKDGIEFLVSKNTFRPKVIIVPDGGDNFVFVNKSKGVAMIEVEATGKNAHASRIWEGKDANSLLCKLVVELLTKYGRNNNHKTWETTMNVGVIRGGSASNQVCDKASMKLDFRFPETRNSKEILLEVQKEAKKIDKALKAKLIVAALPTYTDISLPITKVFIKEFEQTIKSKVKVEAEMGATDARHFAKYKIPLLVIKPTGGGIHSPDEWISLSGCIKYHNSLENFIDKIS